MRGVQAKEKATKASVAKGTSKRKGVARVEKEKESVGQGNGSNGAVAAEPEARNGEAIVLPPAAPPKRRATAETMATRQREISISEFFTKNRHLLGFDNPQKALLTAIKEAVDNALDACEEAGILPEIRVEINQLAEDRFRILVQDNGPGIVKNQIPKIFGKLLYGSKFHTLKQARGQQGIGISAAGMYGQLTTARPICITSRIGKGRPAHYYEIQINTVKNTPEVIHDKMADWEVDHGTRVEIELQAVYKKGRRSVDDYVAQTAIANPHAQISYRPPSGEVVEYPRAVEQLPPEPTEIKPHPYGVELGMLIKMLKDSKSRNLKTALERDFSRVSARVALEICRQAELEPTAKPGHIAVQDAEKLFKAISQVKIMSPPTNCLSPIGEAIVRQGLEKQIKADFYASVTRPPAVYRGNPFQVEVGIAYGGDLPTEELIDLLRFANRVPLLYQQSACAITKAVTSVDWRNYGLQHPKGSLPIGPMTLFVHIASVWVPFTSESKEAIAHYPEILKELRLALQECGRQLGIFLRSRHRAMQAEQKRSYIEKFIPHIGVALHEILGLNKKEEARVVDTLKGLLERSRE
jgi:DNA topoisomerase-6 subunit B